MKYNQVRKICPIAKYPLTFEKIWDDIPDSVIKKSTSQSLSYVVSLAYDNYSRGFMEQSEYFDREVA